jgi:A/G-specific adenine glycosylase
LSLPEFAVGTDIGQEVQRLGYRIVSSQPMPEATHTFTHFRLRLHPRLCEVEDLPQAADSAARWLDAKALRSAPLPAPIRKLLTAFFDQPPV